MTSPKAINLAQLITKKSYEIFTIIIIKEKWYLDEAGQIIAFLIKFINKLFF